MGAPKLAVIGASHFQLPLIEKAQEMGCEVHAFAWECGDVGESVADVFHPVSIVDVDQIVDECREIGIDGICTIASDLATLAVNHVASEMGLIGNSLECTEVSTNKRLMRRAFAGAGDPSPKSLSVGLAKEGATADVLLSEAELSAFDPTEHGLSYPLIIKPVDRSGSRGVTKLESPNLPITPGEALKLAFEQGFEPQAVVEEFAYGDEFSVEGMSWKGTHHILAITRKGTTGAPHFIETAHLQPSGLDEQTVQRVCQVVMHALDTLGVEYGASHSELKVASDGTIRIIEIGARMGGDCIGSHLVPLSTGIDFTRAVVDVALGREPDLSPAGEPAAAAIRFLFTRDDREILERVKREHPEMLCYELMTSEPSEEHVVSDSSTRLGHFILSAPSVDELEPYLPRELTGTRIEGAAS